MKKVLSCILSALVAVSFAGLVSAADTVPGGTRQAANLKSATDTGAKKVKKDRLKRKKSCKVKSESGVGSVPTAPLGETGGGTTEYFSPDP